MKRILCVTFIGLFLASVSFATPDIGGGGGGNGGGPNLHAEIAMFKTEVNNDENSTTYGTGDLIKATAIAGVGVFGNNPGPVGFALVVSFVDVGIQGTQTIYAEDLDTISLMPGQNNALIEDVSLIVPNPGESYYLALGNLYTYHVGNNNEIVLDEVLALPEFKFLDHSF
jgi:hypothetical protein